MTGHPKLKDMDDRGASSQLQIEDGHHDRETGLRNKSGKVVTQECAGGSNPAISSVSITFSSKKFIHYNEGNNMVPPVLKKEEIFMKKKFTLTYRRFGSMRKFIEEYPTFEKANEEAKRIMDGVFDLKLTVEYSDGRVDTFTY